MMIRACASRCVQVGEHLPDCADDSCRGCAPRLAAVGVLCPHCWARLQAVVRTLPSLVAELMSEDAAPSSSSSSSGRRPPGPSSLYPQRRAAADEIAAALASWCVQAGEHLGAEAPRPPGLWWSAPGRKIDPDTGEAYFVESEPVGVRDPAACAALVRWIDPLLDRVAAAPWAADMIEDLGRLEAGARARWGADEPDRRVRDIACPSCGAHSLVVHPTRVVGGDEQVSCSRPACSRVLAPEDWRQLRAWSVLVARMGAPDEGAP